MALIGNLILRLIVVSFGYTFACIAAGCFLAFGFFTEVIAEFFSEFRDLDGVGTLENGSAYLAALTLSLLTGWFSFVPSVFVIAFAELMRWQGMVINLLMGGATAFITGLYLVPRDELASLNEGTLIVLLATGFVAGFVYWAIAGNGAGKWLGEPVMESRQPEIED